MNETDSKICIINSHGRFIQSTKKFAKALSLKHDDIEWRYFFDYFRHEADWKAFKNKLDSDGDFTFDTRLRNRLRRSYRVTLACRKISDTKFRVDIV